MAAYFNDTRRYPDSLHILLGNQRPISIAAVPSTRFLNAVYPIPLRKPSDNRPSGSGLMTPDSRLSSS